MLKIRAYISLLFFLVLFSFAAKATHNRAGEISYKRIPPFTKVVGGTIVQVYTYSITVIIYTDDTVLTGGGGVADRCQDTVYFGDQFQGVPLRGVAYRINNPSSICGCGTINNVPVGCGEMIVQTGSYKVKQNIYTIEHTYPGPGTYIISTLDPNRNQNVHNIHNSVNQPFYVESKLVINSFTGANSSPLFSFAPVDQACLNSCFEHNPGAYDPDGDSLSYEITTSKGADGNTVAGYEFPNADGGTYEIDPVSGLLKWCNPLFLGEYNLAFKVNEWRKNTDGKYELIGYVLRDMQVIVKYCTNSPPSITAPVICVEAGKTVTANLIVSDADDGDLIKVEGGGGAFAANSPVATFNPQSGFTYTSSGSSFAVFFSWQTTCDHIRNQAYYTTFKVEDNGANVNANVHLVSFNTMVIKVVPPTVKDVTATPSGSNMKVSWTTSTCSPLTNPLMAYRIYRKQDCTPYIPDPCQTGIPNTSGFTLIGNSPPQTSEYIDTNNGNGLVVGQDYSYIVVAVYKDSTQTFGSSQICAKLKRDVPVLLNVDVDSTSQTGKIKIRWARPLTTPNNLDTTNLPKPYRFSVKHSVGTNTNFTVIKTFTANSVAQLDTQFVQVDFDTETKQHEYIVDFYTDTILVGSSQKSSSVFLKTKGSDRKIILDWTSKTPWKNNTYSVMRRDSTSPSFNLIGTTSQTSFTDKNNVVNGSNYCYYVISEGEYSDPSIYKPLINRSQISCAKAVDTIAPSTPTINIDADCQYGTVEVNWTDISSVEGSDDVLKYELFYKPLVNGVYTRIAEVLKNQPLFFKQDDPNSFSGCYAVKATDIYGNEGSLSPDFCIDNCPEFELPNVFTPNEDGVNDFFKAIKVKQIKEIDLAIVDRWGNLIYTTKDPYFKWDGVSTVSKVAVSEGTFFFVCHVYEPRLKGIVKRTIKGTVQVIR